MPDRLFAEPRLAAVYDALDSDRSDLDVYVELLIDQLGVRSVIDIGCGTGTLAIMLASRGINVTAVDPAEASLAVARAKPGAEAVRWILGDAHMPGAGPADAVTMTGNVAQVFLTDDDWAGTLHSAFEMLRPGGHVVFETRDPTAKAWRNWHRPSTYRKADVSGVGPVACWEEITAVHLPMVSFQTTFDFAQDGSTLISESTLRFRDRDEVMGGLAEAGFDKPEIREAPDRSGQELVFLARRPAS